MQESKTADRTAVPFGGDSPYLSYWLSSILTIGMVWFLGTGLARPYTEPAVPDAESTDSRPFARLRRRGTARRTGYVGKHRRR